jgi:hypothetical protein
VQANAHDDAHSSRGRPYQLANPAAEAFTKIEWKILTWMNIATEIASPDFVPEHPELHHYTDIAGLEGIYQSHTIWAMQFDQLNDATEFMVLKEPLSLALGEPFATVLKNRQRQSLKIRRAIHEMGGGIAANAKYQASRFVNGFYESSFQNPDQGSAYLISFCTHAKDEYARQNGLLSQWRGYGKGSGYCLVFDTAALLELLQKEFEAHHWVLLRLDQVLYHTSNFSIEAIFGSLLDEADELLSALLQSKAPPKSAIAHFMLGCSTPEASRL